MSKIGNLQNENETYLEIIKDLKELGCFKIGKFTLKSGKLSNYYIDFRCLVSYPKILSKISSLLYKKIEDKLNSNSVICGLPYAGIPYAQCISLNNNIPMILLRKEQKQYGTKKMIEGVYVERNELILIDDIITSGTSILESLKYFQKKQIKCVGIILDRNEGGVKRLKEEGINVVNLFSISDFI